MEQSWFRMRASVVGAAGFLNGSEFHEFDASVIGVVEVELPLAVAANLGFFVAAPTVLAKLRFRGVNVGDAESDVVHDAECVMVSVGRDVEHVFDPVSAIGDLHVDPAGFVVVPSAMPVDVEAENVFVEAIFGGAVVNDEASVNYLNKERSTRRRIVNGICKSLDEGDLIALRIADLEVSIENAFLECVFSDFGCSHTMRDKVATHPLDIVCTDGYGSEQVPCIRPLTLFQFDRLTAQPADRKTLAGGVEAHASFQTNSVESRIKFARLGDIRDVYANAIDTSDSRAAGPGLRGCYRASKQTNKDQNWQLHFRSHWFGGVRDLILRIPSRRWRRRDSKPWSVGL